MELDQLWGLPAHPLVVHAAVVLLPLAAITTLLCAAVPRARRHYAPVALGLALVATLAVGLAQGSGEELEEQVDESEASSRSTPNTASRCCRGRSPSPSPRLPSWRPLCWS